MAIFSKISLLPLPAVAFLFVITAAALLTGLLLQGNVIT